MSDLDNRLTRQRLNAVREQLQHWQVDGLLVGSGSNRRWLSGFSGSAGWLLVTEKSALIGTDFRYWDQASRQASAFELFRFKGRMSEIWPEFLKFDKPMRIGVESRHVTLAQFDEIQKSDVAGGLTFVKLEGSLEELREVKAEVEISKIRAAAGITDLAMAAVNELAQPGMQETQLAWELERRMREEGATGMAFDIIVASGPNAAMAHHSPGARELRAGDSLIVDMGAELDGYASDLTRSFFMGAQPDAKYLEVYDLVQRAQKNALAGIRAGLTGKEADSLARDIIAEAGFGEAFGHSLGHGLGLDVHEGPRLSQLAADSALPDGAVVTVEPGIYIPDWGGIRIEDLVRVTEQGVDMISQCPKTPVISI